MIYRLLLDQALTVPAPPVVFFSRFAEQGGQKRICDIKSSLACLLTDKSSFVY